MSIIEKRNEIDKIDREILSLFEKRMDAVKSISKEKRKDALQIRDIKREKYILDRVKNVSRDDLSPYAVSLFKSILKISRDYQSELNKNME